MEAIRRIMSGKFSNQGGERVLNISELATVAKKAQTTHTTEREASPATFVSEGQEKGSVTLVTPQSSRDHL